MDYKKHRMNIYPEMQPDEFERLRTDIFTNGYDPKNPVWLFEGEIIDGWNRYKACQALGITPVFRTFEGSTLDALQFLVRTNNRRDLNSSQRAAIAVEAEDLIAVLKAEAKAAQVKAGENFGRGNQKLPQLIAEANIKEQNEVRVQLAKTFNTNKQYVSEASRLKRENPQAFEAIKSGQKVITEVKREEKAEQIKQRREEIITQAKESPEMSLNEFSLIYADPPWRYDFSNTQNRDIENHYPTMSTEDICNMKIPAAKDCVLYMWATAPKLIEAMQVIKAWGFDYKTHLIWDKETIGMGYWFRGQHELLMVATKGNISPPDSSQRISSVFREKKTQHSRKPHEFYNYFENWYPDLTKVELFARNDREGWYSWGNQI